MGALTLTGHALHKAEMEYHGKFFTYAWKYKYIDLMIRIDLCYETWNLYTQTVAPNLTVFQGNKLCVQYLASLPHKPIFYPSNSYDRSNAIRLTWSGNQVEYHTTQNCLEFHQD